MRTSSTLSGLSNTSNIGSGIDRFENTYTLRRHVEGSESGLPCQVRFELDWNSAGSMYGMHRRTADRPIQIAGDRQDGVANGLAFQPPPRHAPEVPVLAIDRRHSPAMSSLTI